MTYLFKLSRRAAASFVMAAFSLSVLACSEAAPRDFLSPDPGGSSTPSPTTPVALVVSAAPSVLPFDQSFVFQAHGRLASGDTVTVAVSWVATGGQISADGRYRGTVPGSHTVTAYAVGSPTLSGSTRVTVSNPGPLFETLEVQPKPVYISGGAHVLFGATARLQSGANTLPTVTWRATGGGAISATGEFAAGLIPGSYGVIATTLDGLLSDTALVVVEPAELTALQLQPRVVTMPGGGTQDFAIATTWTDGSAFVPELEWITSAGTVEMVGAAGAGPQATPSADHFARFTASREPGNHKLVVRHRATGKSDTATVTITPVLEQVEVTPGGVELHSGVTAAFTAKGRMSDGVQSNVTVSWSATGGTINGSGIYTAGPTAGEYRVIGRLTGGTLADTSVVRITAPAAATLTGISVAPATGTAPVGGTVEFSATATWSDGSTALPALNWTAQAGTVTPEGVWTAPSSPGSYRIIARQAGGTRADTAVFNVVVPPAGLTALAVSPEFPAVLGGQSVDFQAQATWSDGSSTLPAITWSATGGQVSGSGRWTAPNVSGVYRVVARANSAPVADTAVVTVSETPRVTSVRVSPRLGALNPGATIQLSTEITWSDGQPREVARTFVATGGSVSMSGLYTAGALAGQVLVVASCAGCSVADTARLTITEPVVPAPVVTRIVLNPSALTLATGEGREMNVSATWDDGSTTVPPLVWSVTGGTMTGLTYAAGSTPGTYRVIVRHAGSPVADTSLITITGGDGSTPPPPPDTTTTPPPPPPGPATLQSLALTPAGGTLAEGATMQFAAVGSMSDGSTSSPSVTWSATGGTITANGVFTAGAAGTATVEATTGAGMPSFTAQATITIIAPQPTSVVPAELPRASVDVTYPTLSGSTINVAAGGNLQAAINSASCGDQIVLAPGATFVGNFTLPKKSCSGWIVLRTGTVLPPAGVRVVPATATLFAKILTPNTGSAISVENGAHHYRLVGIEVSAQAGVTQAYTLVNIHGTNPNTLAEIPTDFILDRVYVHGHANLGFQRCVLLNSARSALVDSYLSECHAKGFDSQALLVYNSPGPILVSNNYLEGAGENVMFGGADPTVGGLIPSDLTVTRNHFFKPLSWKGDWTVKNLFEIKNAQRVLLEGNVFENTWRDGQADAIVLKSAQAGSAPWSTGSDITFQYNIVRGAPNAVNVAAAPSANPVVPAARIKIAHNLFEQIGSSNGTTGSWWGLFLGPLRDIEVVNNTVITNIGTSFVTFDGNRSAGPPADRIIIADNHVKLGQYGIFGSGVGTGTSALSGYWKTWEVLGNVFVASGSTSNYPAGNTIVSSTTTSLFGRGRNGSTPGVDAILLATKTAGVK